MNKEKQIKEMAVEFAKINCNPKGCYNCNLCDEYGSLELNCEDYLAYRTMAETFYNAGYRKQSKGEWEEYQIPPMICCSECDWGTSIDDKQQFKYCPNCGAKMKGGE